MARKIGPTGSGSSKGGRGSGTKTGRNETRTKTVQNKLSMRSSHKAIAKRGAKSMPRGEPRPQFVDDRGVDLPARTGRSGGSTLKVSLVRIPASRRPRLEKIDRPIAVVATLPPLHPGEVLREEFLEPMGLSAGQLAKACGVPRTRIERIAAETMGISGDTALRLGRFFGTDPRFWMNLQVRYELETAKASAGAGIEAIRPHQAA